MSEFYRYGRVFCLAVLMSGIIVTIIQSCVLILSRRRLISDRVQKAENLAEFFVLAHIFVLSLMMSRTYYGFTVGLLVSQGYTAVRWALSAAITASAAAVSVKSRSHRLLSAAAASVFTLPYIESAAGRYFPEIYIASAAFWGLRGLYLCYIRMRELKNSISSMSVKEAMDSLLSGLMFCRSDGSVLLINRRMQKLMSVLTGRVQRDANHFLDLLAGGQVLEGCEKAELDGHAVYRLPDKSAWIFAVMTVTAKNKQYRQISASEVTAQWDSTIQLREQNSMLEQKSGELKNTIENLKTISREEEALRAKSHIHDVLGQRVALLLRMLRENGSPDMTVLNSFENGLADILRIPEGEPDFQRDLQSLSEVFRNIGVSILFCGTVPDTPYSEKLFMEIITEAATNAVRHSFSTEVRIDCCQDEKNWFLSISDNGISAGGEISEGGGLSGIRRKIQQAEGTLSIRTEPDFALGISLPKGAQFYEDDTDS